MIVRIVECVVPQYGDVCCVLNSHYNVATLRVSSVLLLCMVCLSDID